MLFRLTIPRDAALVPTVRQVAERVAQCAGYSAADAARIASTIIRAVDIAVTLPGSRGDDSVDIQFRRDGLYLDVWLRYRSEDCDRPVVDPTLSSEALRQGMDSVEFGREGDVAFCRLRRALPREKVDHHCEIPREAR